MHKDVDGRASIVTPDRLLVVRYTRAAGRSLVGRSSGRASSLASEHTSLRLRAYLSTPATAYAAIPLYALLLLSTLTCPLLSHIKLLTQT